MVPVVCDIRSPVWTLGPHREPADETADVNSKNLYAASKVEAETLFQQLAAEDPEARVPILWPSTV